MRRREWSGRRGAKRRRGLRLSRRREEQRGMLEGRQRGRGRKKRNES
jgi:hypothetical protein